MTSQMFDVPLFRNIDVPDVLGCSKSSESSEALDRLQTEKSNINNKFECFGFPQRHIQRQSS